ncbi:DUF3253 domain-containing protein [Salinicola acroporae]|uniref:DUF3253 domain-containing protein n=1 Tax=Salinicola acroporae TaxID=1541440 RepID=A0ABT6I8R7_9GAMM|nr:DUF3253 domain-containing protein [Salinicola acroporae]MDH4573923.1 DUF3253 domain-containing protein [Salinicola acroporae]
MASSPDPAALRRAILAMAESRGPAKTFCPSEVARQLDDDWRPLMAPVRASSRELAREGRLDVLQRGRTLSPEAPWHGAIRLQSPADRDG